MKILSKLSEWLEDLLLAKNDEDEEEEFVEDEDDYNEEASFSHNPKNKLRRLPPTLKCRKLKDTELENLWRILQNSYLVNSMILGQPSTSFNEKVKVDGEQINTEDVAEFLRIKFEECVAKPTINVVHNAHYLNITLSDLSLESFGVEKFLSIEPFDVNEFDLEFAVKQKKQDDDNPLLKKVRQEIGHYVRKNKKPGFLSLDTDDKVKLVFSEVLRPSQINAIAQRFVTKGKSITIIATHSEDLNSGTVLQVTFTEE